MSGTVVNKIILFLLICFTALYSQDYNSIIDPEDSTEILYGEISVNDLNEPPFALWYVEEYAVYNVDNKYTEKLYGLTDNITIAVVLGTWCHDSHREVPRFIKILENIKFDFKRLTIYAVDRGKDAGVDNFEQFDIQFVPTMIIYKDGEELGRIIESPEKSLEIDLYNILVGKK